MTDEAPQADDLDDARRALDEIDDPEVPAEGNSPVPTLEAGAMDERQQPTGERQAAENQANDPPA